MTANELEEMLIAWGRVYGKGHEFLEERSLTGNCNLARIIGKPKQDSTVRRDGISRRTMMAAQMSVNGRSRVGLRAIPKWATDPVPCVQTSSHKPEEDRRETPALTLVQSAWLALHRESESSATALRLHYQRRDLSREQRARELQLTVRAYRDTVARARAFIQQRLSLDS